MEVSVGTFLQSLSGALAQMAAAPEPTSNITDGAIVLIFITQIPCSLLCMLDVYQISGWMQAECVFQHNSNSRALAGAVIAAATDLTFSLYGYSAVIGNDFLTALYLILVKNTPATAGLTTTGLLFYNAALSLPILGVALAASSEPAGIIAYPDAGTWGFRVGHSLYVHLAFLLCCRAVKGPLIRAMLACVCM